MSAAFAAGPGTEAAMCYAQFVCGTLEDIEAAIAEGEFQTAIQCARIGVRYVAYCRLLLDRQIITDDRDVFPSMPSLTGEEDQLPLPLPEADDESAAAAHELFVSAAAALEARLPFEIPPFRTPEGLYPTLRMVRSIEQLRAELGIAPYTWPFAVT